MSRCSYEYVIVSSEPLLRDITHATSIYDIIEKSKIYLSFINACGWTNQSLDNETLKRIDNSWKESNYV